MGSFTTLAATKLMAAVFPNNNSTNTNKLSSSALSTTTTSLKIYNTTPDVSGNVGIYSSAISSNMQHAIHLIRGVGASESATYTMADANFTASGFAGTATGTGSPSLAIPIQGDYGAYSAVRMAVGGSPATADAGSGGTLSTTWFGWKAISAGTGGVAQVQNDGPITFPTSSASSTNPIIIGFLITADLAWTTGTFSAATGSGTSVIAYGELSSSRKIQQTDTPVFTDMSITITLA
jgi:hypothetical protein